MQIQDFGYSCPLNLTFWQTIYIIIKNNIRIEKKSKNTKSTMFRGNCWIFQIWVVNGSNLPPPPSPNSFNWHCILMNYYSKYFHYSIQKVASLCFVAWFTAFPEKVFIGPQKPKPCVTAGVVRCSSSPMVYGWIWWKNHIQPQTIDDPIYFLLFLN